MNEYVLISYAEDRGVFVDGSAVVAARTNIKFAVNPGVHAFRLDGAPDFDPESITEAIGGTSWLLPKILTFRRKATVQA